MQILSRGLVARARNATFVKVPPQMTGGLRAPYTLCSGHNKYSPQNSSATTKAGDFPESAAMRPERNGTERNSAELRFRSGFRDREMGAVSQFVGRDSSFYDELAG